METSEFEKRIVAFQNKIDAKKESLRPRIDEIKATTLARDTLAFKNVLLDQNASLLPPDNSFSDPIKLRTGNRELYTFNADRDQVDGDTIKQNEDSLRLAFPGYGTSLDTYETAKYVDGKLQPYKANVYDAHRQHYADIHGLPSKEYVTQKMLNDGAIAQNSGLLEKIYEGTTWGEYGSTLKDGTVVPFPKKVQSQLDILKIELDEAFSIADENAVIKENRTPTMAASPGAVIPSIAADAFIYIKDSVVKSKDKRSVLEINELIRLVKLSANQARGPIDPSLLTGDVVVDIRKNGVDMYNRALSTLYNVETKENINVARNTPADNPGYMSYYNKEFARARVDNMYSAFANEAGKHGYGFWSELGTGTLGGIDNVQATGFGFAALYADATGDYEGATQFLDLYLKEIDSALERGVPLPTVEELDWTNPKAVLSKLGRVFGEGIPSIALMFGTGGIAGFLARRAGTAFAKNAVSELLKAQSLARISKWGTGVGIVTPAIGMETGSIWGTVATDEEGNIDRTDRMNQFIAIAGGTSSGLLEALLPATLFRKFGINKALNPIKAKFGKRFVTEVRKVATAFASGGVTEGSTEGFQFIISEIAEELIRTKQLPDFDSDEFKSGFWNSVFAGIIPGGGIRATSATLSGTKNVLFSRDKQAENEYLRKTLEDAENVRNKEVYETPEAAKVAAKESEKILKNELNKVIKEVNTAKLDLNNVDANYINSRGIEGNTDFDKGITLLESLNAAKINESNETTVSLIDNAIEKLESTLRDYKTGNVGQDLENTGRVDAAIASIAANTINTNTETAKESLTPTGKPRQERYKARLDKERQEALSKVSDDAVKRNTKVQLKAKKIVQKAVEKVKIPAIIKNIEEYNKVTEALKNKKLPAKDRKRLIRLQRGYGNVLRILSKEGPTAVGAELYAQIPSEYTGSETKSGVSIFDTNYEQNVKQAIDELSGFIDELIALHIDDEASANEILDLSARIYDLVRNLKIFLAEINNGIINSELTDEDKARFQALAQTIQQVIDLADSTLKDYVNNIEDTARVGLSDEEDEETVKPTIFNSLDVDTINTAASTVNDEDKAKLSAKEKNILKNLENIEKLSLSITSLIGSDKNMQETHADIIGTGNKQKIDKDKGIKDYLNLAKNGNFDPQEYVNFVKRLQAKVTAFNRAYEFVLKQDKDVTVYISKEYVNGAYKVGTKVPEGTETYQAGEYTRYKGYWFIFKGSKNLVDLLNMEVKYAELMNKHVVAAISNQSESFKNNQKDKAIKKAAEQIKLAAGQTIADQIDINDIDPNIINTEERPEEIETTNADYKIISQQYEDSSTIAGQTIFVNKTTSELTLEELNDSIATIQEEIKTIESEETNTETKEFKSIDNNKPLENLKKDLEALVAELARRTEQSKPKETVIDTIPKDIVLKYSAQDKKLKAINYSVESTLGAATIRQEEAIQNLMQGMRVIKKKYPNIEKTVIKVRKQNLEAAKKKSIEDKRKKEELDKNVKLVFSKFSKGTSDVLKLAALGTDIEVIQEIKKRLNNSIFVQKDNIDRDPRESAKNVSRTKKANLEKLLVLVNNKLKVLQSSSDTVSKKEVTKPKVKPKEPIDRKRKESIVALAKAAMQNAKNDIFNVIDINEFARIQSEYGAPGVFNYIDQLYEIANKEVSKDSNLTTEQKELNVASNDRARIDTRRRVQKALGLKVEVIKKVKKEIKVEELKENAKKVQEQINLLEKAIEKDTIARDVLRPKKDKTSLEKIAKLENRIFKNQDLLNDLAKDGDKTNTKLKRLNHFLNKNTESFLDLRSTGNLLKVIDFFKIKNLSRDSFFSKNSNKVLTKKNITSILNELEITDTKYIEAVTTNFVLFKDAFNNFVKKELTDTQSENGILAIYDPDQMLSVIDDKTGKSTLPDEVLFAMMLELMHWAGVNKNSSRNMPRHAIAKLLFNDSKAVRRITPLQQKTFGPMGPTVKSVSFSLGEGIFDSLNIKANQEKENEFAKIIEIQQKYPELKNTIIKDPVISNRASVAIGTLTILVGQHLYLPKNLETKKVVEVVKINNKNVPRATKETHRIIENGLLNLRHGKYSTELFPENESDETTFTETIDGKAYKLINTITIPDTDELNNLLDVFNDNTKQLDTIKGSQSRIGQIYFEPLKEAKTNVFGSYFKTNDKAAEVIEALQQVEHIGKLDVLSVVNILNDDVLDTILQIKDVSKQSDYHKPAIESANKEKIRDKENIKEYVNDLDEDGNFKPFFYEWLLQKQHRYRINGNKLNYQASKIVRHWFKVNLDKNKIKKNDVEQRHLFKLSIVEALGGKITTVTETEKSFDAYYKLLQESGLLPLLLKPEANKDEINNQIKILIDINNKNDIEASAHLIEGLVALSQYKEDKIFRHNLSYEIDGITNGYAHGLMQFYIDVSEDYEITKKENIIDQLNRIGVYPNIDNKLDTHEKFIARGELDVYEYFSNTIIKKITNKQNREIIDTVHGKFFDEITNRVTSFARSVAKSPVMISSYQAAATKVVQDVVEDIIPDLYIKLSDIQTEYDSATKERQEEIQEELLIFQRFLRTNFGINVGLKARLSRKGETTNEFDSVKQNNLYGFEFTFEEKNKFERKFRKIYEKPIVETLNEIIGPIKETKDLLIHAVEETFIAWQIIFEKYSKGEKNIATKEAIAQSLAEEHMPRFKGPWSTNEDGTIDYIQLIRRTGEESNAVQVNTQGIANKVITRLGDQETVIQDRLFKYLQVIPLIPEYESPGVSALINQILNLDSVNMGRSILKDPNRMFIHDAIITDIGKVIESQENFNDDFFDINTKHSILEETTLQHENLLDKLSTEELIELDSRIQKESFLGKKFRKTYQKAQKKYKENNNDVNKEAFEKAKKEFNKWMVEGNQLTTRAKLQTRIKQTKKTHNLIKWNKNTIINQAYVPASIKDPKLKPANTKNASKSGVESNEEAESRDKEADIINSTVIEEIATSQEDPKNANTKPDKTMSSIDEDTEQKLEEFFKEDDLSNNLFKIFDFLEANQKKEYTSKIDKTNQQKHLRKVLKDIVSKATDVIANTTVILSKTNIRNNGRAAINDVNNIVNVNINKYAPRSYSEQTAQEVYVHELIHPIIEYVLNTNVVIRTNAERIRKQVIREIEKLDNPYEVFLSNRDSNGEILYLTNKQEEIEAAQKQYNYVFGINAPAGAELDEFITYGLTNKHLVKFLAGMKSEKIPYWSKEASFSVVEKLVQFFEVIVDNFIATVTNKKLESNVQLELMKLTKEIIAINENKKQTIREGLFINRVGSVTDTGNKIISDFVKNTASKGLDIGGDKYNKLVDVLTKEGKINTFLANVLYDTKLVTLLTGKNQELIKNHPKIQLALSKIYGKVGFSTRKNMSSLKTDLLGNVDQRFVRLLYKSNKEVDTNRRQYKEMSKETLRQLWGTYSDLDDTDKESVTKVLLKTDFSLLISSGAFSVEEALELLTDKTKLKAALKTYEQGLSYTYLAQSRGLASAMVTGNSTTSNQDLNAKTIYESAKEPLKSNIKATDIIRSLDIYISLLAVELTAESTSGLIERFNKIAKNEIYDKDGNYKIENGISGTLELHTAFKKKSLEEGFLDKKNRDKDNKPLPNETQMMKGYITTIVDPDRHLVSGLATEENIKKLTALGTGIEFISYFPNLPGGVRNPNGLFLAKNDPDLSRNKGILSVKGKRSKGMSMKQVLDSLGYGPKEMMIEIEKVQILQKQEQKEAKKRKSQTSELKWIPIKDDRNNIVDYRFPISHQKTEQYLDQTLMFDEVLPTMFSQLEDKINSEKINSETIKVLARYGRENYKKSPRKFINILDPRFEKEYLRPLPAQAKEDFNNYARIGKESNKVEFWIETGLLDMVFGYQNPSISELGIFNSFPRGKRYAKIVEKLIKEMVSLAVVNIVIKIPIVPIVNFASNFVTSMLYGVPPIYLIKKWKEGIFELRAYQTMAKELKLLDLRILAKPGLANDFQTQKRRKSLVFRMNKNKVSPFVEQGLFNSITEDINQDEFTYRNKALNKLKEKGNKLVTGSLLKVASHAYLGEQTAIFKASMHFLQISDFIARYALYSHQTEQRGMSKDKAYKLMIETFVNYDQPLNRYLAYGNDIGAILFIKYWMRIQRAGLNLIKEKPVNVMLLLTGNSLLDLDIETILNSSIVTGNLLPTPGGLDKILSEVFIPPGIEILTGEGF
tara:strand:+ start:5089 stop:17610 length:12522 start_codon:yes stop_codon:yes gene_type:complete